MLTYGQFLGDGRDIRTLLVEPETGKEWKDPIYILSVLKEGRVLYLRKILGGINNVVQRYKQILVRNGRDKNRSFFCVLIEKYIIAICKCNKNYKKRRI